VTVVWSPRAIGHLAALRDYIARENPGAAARTATTLLAAVDRLAELPNLGRPGRVSGTRELVVPGTRYVIPYRVRGERLEIIAVFHGRQRWPRRLSAIGHGSDAAPSHNGDRNGHGARFPPGAQRTQNPIEH
jgi:toxin ParE1/3/4